VPHLSHEHQHPLRFSRHVVTIAQRRDLPAAALTCGADRLNIVRYLALLVLAVVFLTGLVWWVFFIGNSVVHLFRRK
jgi:hypothetical protein